MRECFAASLVAVGEVMEEQINNVHNRGIDVDVVILVGGFSDSPALRRYLKSKLKQIETQCQLENANYKPHIKLLFAPQ